MKYVRNGPTLRRLPLSRDHPFPKKAGAKLVADPAKNFVPIMKDGKVYKNTLSKEP